jgi:hypothetical protein
MFTHKKIARKLQNFTKISQYYREYSIYDNIAKFWRFFLPGFCNQMAIFSNIIAKFSKRNHKKILGTSKHVLNREKAQ